MNKSIIKILNEIESHGYEAYIVGGYVRDYLLNRQTYDIDICTNATPKNLVEIFKAYKNKKIKDNSLIIYSDNYDFEITTYRLESNYIDRRPSKIVYTNNLIEDLNRRDFTMNSLCMNKSGVIIDLLNGREDIESGIIKCVGDVESKLKEDPLRILRAIRFTATLGLKLDDNLKRIIKDNNYLVSTLSGNRIKLEMSKILTSDLVMETFVLIKELDLYNIIDMKFDKLVPCNDLLGMYAQLNMGSKYTFTKQESRIINDVVSLLKYGLIDNVSLFDYGLYINTLAASIMGIDKRVVNVIYSEMPIKRVKDLNISANDICQLLGISPCKKIKEVQEVLIKKVLVGELKNNYSELKRFLLGGIDVKD